MREAVGAGGADPRRRQRRLGRGDGEADAGASWSRSTIELAEQPVATLEEAAELAASTSIPLAGDESVESRADAERAVALGACA